MDIEKAIKILKEFVKQDRKMRDYKVESDYDKFCEERCIAIETVLNELEKKDKIIDEMAEELVELFHLDKKKKTLKLSKGMLSMLSIVLALASKAEFTFLDEPVSGLDVVAREQFYRLLLEEFTESGRTFVISTHIIEEIAKTIQKLIIIDKGSVCFFDTLQSVETRAFRISGLQRDVEAATKDLNVIGQDTLGGLVTAYIFDNPPVQSASLEIHQLSLQDFFIQMVGHKGGAAR